MRTTILPHDIRGYVPLLVWSDRISDVLKLATRIRLEGSRRDRAAANAALRLLEADTMRPAAAEDLLEARGRHRRARAPKFAAVLGLLVSSLLVHGAPAQATTSYDVMVGATISECFTVDFCRYPVPAGTSLNVSLGAGSTSTPTPIQIGTASAFTFAHTAPQSPPFPFSQSSASAEASGTASAPPASFAASFASAVIPSVLSNLNNTTELFPITFSAFTTTFTTLGQDQLASAQALGSVQLLIDGTAIPIERDGNRLTVVGPSAFSPFLGLTIFTVPVTPGFHSVLLEVEASGFASEMSPTPEPTTLLLFATTGAALGLARWVRRGRQHAA